jgi:WD40 repeat protein
VADVFLSYSRRDYDAVRRLADALGARGKDVWIDIEGIRDAEVFPAALRSAIEASDGFVFVISPESVRSPYCVQEVDHAVHAGKRIVPVELEKVADGEVPDGIRERNWIPFEGDGGFEASVERVAAALDTDLEHVKAHTRWDVKALEWQNEGRERSFLLRGAELSAAEGWLAAAAGRDPPPTGLQREYLLASRQAAARRQRIVVAVSVAVAVASVALLVFALIQRGHALTQRSEARSARTINKSRALAFESENQQAVDPERAVLIAMEAARAEATPDALFALRAALDNDPLQGRLPGVGSQHCAQLGPSVAYAPTRLWLLVGLCDGAVRVVDTRTDRTVRALHLRHAAVPLRFSPDGSLLVIGTDNGAWLYDGRTLAPLRRLRGPGHPERIAFSADGSLVGATGPNRTGRSWATVWATSNGRRRLLLSAPPAQEGSSLRGIAFVRDGRAVVVGRASRPVAVVDLGSGRVERALPGTGGTSDVTVSHDGARLAVGSYQINGPQSQYGLVTVWDTRTWRRVAVVARLAGNAASSLAFTPDGSRLAVGWYDGSAGVWTIATRARLARFLGPAGPVSSVAVSSDGRHVLVAAADGSLRVWRGGGSEGSYFESAAHIDVALPALSGGQLTLLSRPNLIRVWRASSFRPVRSFRLGRAGNYSNASLSDDGRLAALSRADGVLEVWDLRGPRRLEALAGHRGAISAFSHDDRKLAVLDGRQNAVVDVATGKAVPLRGRAAGCPHDWQAAALSRDDRVLVGGTQCGQYLAWDARTGALTSRLDTRAELAGLDIAPSGRTVALASQDGRELLWDPATGARRSIAGSRGIDSLAFSGDGRLLVSGGVDKAIRVDDVRSGRLLRVMRVQNLVGVRFGDDGRTLVSSELGGVVRFWRPCPGCGDATALLAEARGLVTRRLTASERRTYLSGF